MTRAELDKKLKNAAEKGTPVEVFDTESQQVYYLISAEEFRRFQSMLSADFDPREFYPLIDKVMMEDDADDPLLDSYQ